MSDYRIRDAGAIALAEVLRVNKVLVRMNLFQNYIQDSGAEYLAEAIRVRQWGWTSNSLVLFEAVVEWCVTL